MLEKLGDWVREQRIAQGWSQDDLAREAEISQQQVSYLETRGGDTITWRVITGLARAFGVSEYELLVETEMISVIPTEQIDAAWLQRLVRDAQTLPPAHRRIVLNLVRALAEAGNQQSTKAETNARDKPEQP